MNDEKLRAFQQAILDTHGAAAKLLARESVHEMFQEGTVWQGDVLVFELENHPSARLCYAWEVDGVVTIVLGEPPVSSAVDAVRTVIQSDVR